MHLFIRIAVGMTLFALAPAVSHGWTGPTQTAPNGNVAAPINVGTVDQVKNANIGVNGIAIFGNGLLSGSNRYLNFGTTAGSGGYGIRDNAGTLEFKNTGGSWQSIQALVSTLLGGGTGITGSGTAGYVPKFTGTHTVSNSQIIDNGTNVGIGMSPSYKLDVNGPFRAIGSTSGWAHFLQNTGGSNSYVYFNHGTYGMHLRNDSASAGTYLMQLYNGSDGSQLQVRGNNSLYINAPGGNWAGDFNTNSAHGIHVNNGYVYDYLSYSYYGLYTNGAVYAAPNNSGYWAGDFRSAGIHGLHASNASGYWAYLSYSSYGLYTNGNVYAPAFYYSSDRSLKENIRPLTGALDKVLKLAGVSFTWKKDAENPEEQIGFIAQDLEEVVPELVLDVEEGLKSVDYARLTPLLVEAIKEQQKQIEELRGKVEQLEASRSQNQ